MKWYVVQAWTNFENRVADHLRDQAGQDGLSHLIGDVAVPKEKVQEVRRGMKINTERKFFPGYVLVKADLTPEVFNMIKSLPHVNGFIGGKPQQPLPISEEEAERILGQMAEAAANPVPMYTYEIGEEVRIIDGPFVDYNGVVEKIDHPHSKITIEITVMGRKTPIDLRYGQVEKA